MASRRARMRDDDGENAGSERRCIATGQCFPPEKLIRFVVGPDNSVVPDLDERLPGRGFWLSADPDMIHTACAKQLFSKAARCKVQASATLAADIERLLVRKCLDRIALARRAGQSVAGYDQVTDRLRRTVGKKRRGVLLAASDGAAGGREKVSRLADGMTVIDLFSSTELGSAIGSERTVHLAIEPGGLADALIRDARRLAGFRRPAHGDDHGGGDQDVKCEIDSGVTEP